MNSFNVVSNLRETDDLIPFVALRGGGDHQTSSSDVPAAGVIAMTKELTASDANCQQSRLMLGKVEAESQILCHWSQEEVRDVLKGKGHGVDVYDHDTKSLHHMTFKRWKGNKSYVLNNNWSAEFVKRRALKAGDKIWLRWDTNNNRFVFSVFFRKFPI